MECTCPLETFPFLFVLAYDTHPYFPLLHTQLKFLGYDDISRAFQNGVWCGEEARLKGVREGGCSHRVCSPRFSLLPSLSARPLKPSP